MAVLDKLLGHETIFAGPEPIAPTMRIFDSVHYIYQSHAVRFGLPIIYRMLQLRIQKIIKKINPDVIHAHDIFCVMLAVDSGYPFVYDDHEYWSKEYMCDVNGRQLFKRIMYPYFSSIWLKRESYIADRAPVITVSDPIADYYKDIGGECFVIPNYPSQHEIDSATFSEKVNDLTTVFIGKTTKRFCSYRDEANFVDFFKKINKPLVCIGKTIHTPSDRVRFTGHIPHMNVFAETSKYHVGVVPWRAHTYHRFCSLNKVYSYAHCGTIVVVTSLFTNVIKEFQGKCRVVNKYEDMNDVLNEMEGNMDGTVSECEENMKFARKNFIFEKYEDTLKEAYKNV